jgi:hypothetical protein
MKWKYSRQAATPQYSWKVEKRVKHFRTFVAAEQSDRDFYKRLSGNERLQLLVELLNHGPEQRLESLSSY